MQHRYVADIGDFGKFQLFRYLFNTPETSLAQIWFLHDKEEANNDGKYCHYFERVKGSDPQLETIMIEILNENNRNLVVLEEKRVLTYAAFFYPPIPDNYHDRAHWIEEALTFSASHPIVAMAPDNGMALKCHRDNHTFSFLDYHDKKSSAHKYIFLQEIDAFYHTANRKITIVYQHLGRCFAHNKQITTLLALLKERYPHTIAIKHKPYSPRIFFFLCRDKEILTSLQKQLQLFEQLHSEFWELFF